MAIGRRPPARIAPSANKARTVIQRIMRDSILGRSSYCFTAHTSHFRFKIRRIWISTPASPKTRQNQPEDGGGAQPSIHPPAQEVTTPDAGEQDQSQVETTPTCAHKPD